MSKGNTFETDTLALWFNATAIANLAMNNSTSPATTITVALHTADPGEAGTQSTSEIAYTGYARVAVNRNSGGWSVSSVAGLGTCSPVANIDFGQMTAGAGGTVTYFSVGTGTSNYLMYSGPVSPTISVVNGVIPRLTTASVITED